jgi:Uncharacterized protein conserved in bacteria (DUF2147)
MNKLYLAAALLMASTAAHAGNSISFEIDGQKIHIEAPKNCDQLSCIQITAPGLSKSSFNLKNLNLKNSGDDDDVADAAPAPKTVPARAAPVTAPLAPAPVASNPQAPTAVASTTPAPVTNYVAPAAPAPSAAAPATPQPAPVAAAPAPASTTPLGIWATEEDKGNVRIEACGTNLCGYADKTGEKILINMKPEGTKWTGRIHDPDSGKDYDSTIAMRGANTLKVQGCAFGGLFCGGQTWKRVG